MKRRLLSLLSPALGVLLAGAPVIAHHSVSAEFDTNKRVTFTGTVKKVEWMNPHIYTQVEVKEADGKVVIYRVEGGAPNALFRRGIRPDFLKPGEIVTVTGSRAKNPASTNISGTMLTSDGRNPLGGQGQ